MNLCDLHGHLLGMLWPPEMLVAGVRVCKSLRVHLVMYATDLSIKALQHTPPGSELQFGIEGQDNFTEFSSGEVCWDFRRMEAVRNLSLDAASCKIEVVPLLEGLKEAQETGWGGKLHALNLSRAMDSPSNMQQLEQTLQPSLLGRHEQMTSLDLSGNRIDFLCTSSLADAMVGLSCIRMLNLSGCRLGGAGFSVLAPTLETCRGLTHLDLARNYIDREGICSIGGILRDCPLVHLDLSRCQIGFDEVGLLATDLCYSTNLTHLNMAGNYVASESGGTLARALASCTRLTHLDLHENTIGCQGISELASQLRKCTALTRLDLHWNRTRSLAAGQLVSYLGTCGLKELNLGWNETGLSNRFYEEATSQLGKALEHSTSLTRLHLCRNFLRDPGVRPITQALCRAQSLAYVHMGFNDIGSKGACYVAEALPSCRSLSHLDLRGNKIGDAGVRELVASLGRCLSLQELNLSSNGIGPDGATVLADALRGCQSMKWVDIQVNQIGRKGADQLELLRESIQVLVDEDIRNQW